ncbi:hypothetical protein AGMMS49944_18270 [Spirochaetia bacterium]|nr:hypothetical protein AGMMS49944_18270 [Spirochaetia bacterium]
MPLIPNILYNVFEYCIENIEYATILRTEKNKILNETEKLIKYFEVDSFLNQKSSMRPKEKID